MGISTNTLYLLDPLALRLCYNFACLPGLHVFKCVPEENSLPVSKSRI